MNATPHTRPARLRDLDTATLTERLERERDTHAHDSPLAEQIRGELAGRAASQQSGTPAPACGRHPQAAPKF